MATASGWTRPAGPMWWDRPSRPTSRRRTPPRGAWAASRTPSWPSCPRAVTRSSTRRTWGAASANSPRTATSPATPWPWTERATRTSPGLRTRTTSRRSTRSSRLSAASRTRSSRSCRRRAGRSSTPRTWISYLSSAAAPWDTGSPWTGPAVRSSWARPSTRTTWPGRRGPRAGLLASSMRSWPGSRPRATRSCTRRCSAASARTPRTGSRWTARATPPSRVTRPPRTSRP